MGRAFTPADDDDDDDEPPTTSTTKPPIFIPSSKVKGLRFGGQFLVKSFTVRRATPPQLLRILIHPNAPPPAAAEGTDHADHSTAAETKTKSLFSSTLAYLPTNFTILAHQALHTLTLGLGTNRSKSILFVFDNPNLKASAERSWPLEISLREINKKLVKGLSGFEMARFKFRKGCITFYVYAVRKLGSSGFGSGEELRRVVTSVVELKDFMDHTAVMAMPNQKSIHSRDQQDQQQRQQQQQQQRSRQQKFSTNSSSSTRVSAMAH